MFKNNDWKYEVMNGFEVNGKCNDHHHEVFVSDICSYRDRLFLLFIIKSSLQMSAIIIFPQTYILIYNHTTYIHKDSRWLFYDNNITWDKFTNAGSCGVWWWKFVYNALWDIWL